jgi:hypothetical protein
MTLPAFAQSLAQPTAPAGLSVPLLALWHAGRGDWERAHELVQADETPPNNLVHAYLHRVEGDTFNAGYWYRRARRPVPTGTLAQEWEQLVEEFLAQGQ